MIPRIIHQTAPGDQGRWSSSWRVCQRSVREVFPDFRYIMWTDEDIDRLAQTHFSWFYPVFKDFPSQIYRADAARYMFLYLYGGIYIDMDMEVLRDFYGALAQDRVSLVESPFPEMETVQNSLMASPPRHPFWIEVLREISSTITIMRDSVLDCTGPRMLSRLYTDTKDIHLLPASTFNPQPVGRVYNATQWVRTRDTPYTRHLCTASWR